MYNGHVKASIARGKLVDKHRNILRDLRKCGLFAKNKNLSQVKINTDNNDCNDSYNWLKNNREPFADIIEHWNKTYTKREQSQAASVAEFIQEWPILSLSNGYVLIDTDFAQKYPESSNHLFRNFDTLMKNVLLHLPEKSGGSVLKSLLNKLNEELYIMANPITCFLCKKQFEAIKALILHFKVSHSLTVGEIVQCKQDFCRRKFNTFCSFKQHLIRKHHIGQKHHIQNKSTLVLSADINSKSHECSKYQQNLDIPSSSNSISNVNTTETKCQNYTVEDIADNIEQQCASFCAKLYANSVIPRSQVQFIFENLMELLSNGFGNLFRTMLESKNETNISNRDIIVKMINLMENSFKNLSSDKLRQRYFENSHYLIQPVSYCVGTIDIFDFLGSPLWNEISKNYTGNIVIPIFLFFDDFEINNPLGSHALTLILGDNLGVNSILGFSDSFSSRFFCRFCRTTKEQCQALCKSEPLLRRTKSNYDLDIQKLPDKSTGIKEPCIWNDLKYFDVTENIAGDIMHDIYEGICRYELGSILNSFIKNKFFSLEFLNQRIKFFNYGIYERNTVPLIKADHIKRCQIIMSAAEMACFVRYLGLIVGDKIPENNSAWQIIGPLINISSMRFEAKHRDLKKNANVVQSRVNITFTVAKKNQLQLCEKFLSKRGFSDNIIFGPCLEVNDTSAHYLWIEINRIKYFSNRNTILLISVDEPLPEFGLISSIICYEDERITFTLKKLFTIGYYSHVDAYEVTSDNFVHSVEIDFNSLINIFPTSGILHYGNTNDKFVCFR
ncbi:hypothetical protein ALC60_12569 [Trachymyrmex zeteki]|uniref:C2H2-type domain-containing protein n=1 Tax=Mycetomoellerius zeteki TaxID=64791 RepID=A0A151WKK3_9HYME|nr:hypothetical protein ALC60_12569 [Trachymyrmex zeteki]